MKRLSPRGVAICVVSFALIVLYINVWFSFPKSPAGKRSDFLIYYTAGRLPLGKLYNLEAQRELQTSVNGAPLSVEGGVLPFNHTPVFVPFLHLLVNDDYSTSYFRWTILLWLAAFACALLIFKMTGDIALAVAAASFYPLFTLIQQAHDTVFILFGLLLGVHLLSVRRDFLAGLALSLAALKPHFAIVLAVPLIARPKAFMGFCSASVLLTLYSVLLVGTGGVFDFLTLLRISAAGEGFGMRPMVMPNLLGLMERAGVSASVARPVAWMIFLGSAIVLLALWKRNSLKPPFALTILLIVFTSPHLHGHDLALLLVCFATLSRSHATFLLAASLALAFQNTISNKWQFAVVYILVATLLIMSIKDVRQADPVNV